mgnify:CR=1 FL=1
MFQSLSGFWWGFCWSLVSRRTAERLSGFNPFQGFGGVSAFSPSVGSKRTVMACFNPFQGFGEVSASLRSPRPLTLVTVSIPFRVLVEFLPCGRTPQGEKDLLVSIPFRVLVEFLRTRGYRSDQRSRLFQSLSGFWWSFCNGCWGPGNPSTGAQFQSLSGFWWSFCGPLGSLSQCGRGGSFNPFQGFGGVSASGQRWAISSTAVGFNPFQGFGGVSALLVLDDLGMERPLFQSLSGFWWSFCEEVRSYPNGEWPGFNPFQGFGGVSAKLKVREVGEFYVRFNPFQGFGGVSARAQTLAEVAGEIAFQSLSGFWWSFCSCCTQRSIDRAITSCFNPFQGFGGVSAGPGWYREDRGVYHVSIPFRVLVEFLQ